MMLILSWLEQPPVRSRVALACLIVSWTMSGLAAGWATVAKEQVREKTERTETLQQVINNLNSATIVVDRDGIIREWNTAAENLLGWTPEEAIGADVTMLMLEKERAQFPSRFNMLLGLGVARDVRHLECWAVHKSGEIRHLLVAVRVARAGSKLFVFATADHFHLPTPVTACQPPPTTAEDSPPDLRQFRRGD